MHPWNPGVFFPAAVSAAFAAASSPAAAQNLSPVELAYNQQLVILNTSLKAAAEPTGARLLLPVSALQGPIASDDFLLASNTPQMRAPAGRRAMAVYVAELEAAKGDSAVGTDVGTEISIPVSASYRFRTEADYERFAPAYGGYRTQTIVKGVLTTDEPVNWTIHGNRLFLTRSPSTEKALREQIAYMIESADRYWAGTEFYVDQYGFGSSPEPVR